MSSASQLVCRKSDASPGIRLIFPASIDRMEAHQRTKAKMSYTWGSSRAGQWRARIGQTVGLVIGCEDVEDECCGNRGLLARKSHFPVLGVFELASGPALGSNVVRLSTDRQ